MVLVIFPLQLFARHPELKLGPARVILTEDSLFFSDKHHPAKFH